MSEKPTPPVEAGEILITDTGDVVIGAPVAEVVVPTITDEDEEADA